MEIRLQYPFPKRVRKRAAPVGEPCRHCKTGKVNRPRGLCWVCFYQPGVRDLYSTSESMYAKRGVGNHNDGRKLPSKPTTAAPGTPQKLEVMQSRVLAKRAIFHPADARFEGDPRPLEWLAGMRGAA